MGGAYGEVSFMSVFQQHRAVISPQLSHRVNKIQKHQDFGQKMGYPVKRNTDSIEAVYQVSL